MVLRYLHFFQLVIIILSVYGFTVALEKQLLCTSNDIDILYSYCGSGRDNFLFSVKPCWLRNRTEWQGTISWIPKADLTVVNARIQLWNGPFKSLKWESTVCHGMDDDYSYCGALKGETINASVNISGSGPNYLKFLKVETSDNLKLQAIIENIKKKCLSAAGGIHCIFRSIHRSQGVDNVRELHTDP